MHLKWYQKLHGMWHEIGQVSSFRATARPIYAKTWLKHTERGTQHRNNGRPSPVCDPFRPNRKYSLFRVSIIFSYSLVIHEGSLLQFPCRTWTGAPEDHLFFISLTTVPPRTSAIQQQSCSSQEIQPPTWPRIASLHLAGTLRLTSLPHGSALHLQITCKLLLCVRLGMSRDRHCGHDAAETQPGACTAVRVRKYHSVRKKIH